jgi:DNA-binding FrmR family transcriptional regulator
MSIPEETTADLTRRLRRIEGQVHGVQQMLAGGRGCRDVLTQITAVRKALDQTGFLLVANGLTWCLAHPDEADDEGNSLEDLQAMFLKLA